LSEKVYSFFEEEMVEVQITIWLLIVYFIILLLSLWFLLAWKAAFLLA